MRPKNQILAESLKNMGETQYKDTVLEKHSHLLLEILCDIRDQLKLLTEVMASAEYVPMKHH